MCQLKALYCVNWLVCLVNLGRCYRFHLCCLAMIGQNVCCEINLILKQALWCWKHEITSKAKKKNQSLIEFNRIQLKQFFFFTNSQDMVKFLIIEAIFLGRCLCLYFGLLQKMISVTKTLIIYSYILKSLQNVSG